jgi:MFS transporter, FHS family, L-fucose permease
VSIATFFVNYADEVAGFSDAKAAKLLSVAQGIFTVGRFFCTFCMTWIRPQYILMTFLTILVALAAVASKIWGVGAITIYMIIFFFERSPSKFFSLSSL